MRTSKHWKNDRGDRAARIQLIGGVGNPLFSVCVDNGHPNGAEIHIVTDNAVITIKNERTKKIVTRLIASPGQLKRYGKPIPENVLNLAIAHVRAGLNY